MGQTSIHLDTETRDRLRALKRGDETYDELVNRILDNGERLRDAADIIGQVAESAPEGDFDPEKLAEFEEEYGEVPSLPPILRELEQTTRTLSILVEAHEGRNHD